MKKVLTKIISKLFKRPRTFSIEIYRMLISVLYKVFTTNYEQVVHAGKTNYSHYGYCILESVKLAKTLNYNKISVIEFGVAGGNGLMAIENHINKIKKEFDIEIEVYGFDLESGLPKSDDYRDLLYKFQGGFFKMDKTTLKNKLEFSQLIIGDVSDTCDSFFDKFSPAPIGCIFFDLDYYSSTKNAFKILNKSSKNYLPRVQCFFDDIEHTDEFVGELLAISEFNNENDYRKISHPYILEKTFPFILASRIFIFHDYNHPDYNTCIFKEDRQIETQLKT